MIRIAPRLLVFKGLVFMALALLIACQTQPRQTDQTGQVAPAPPQSSSTPADTAPQPAVAPTTPPAVSPTPLPPAPPSPAPQRQEPQPKATADAPSRLFVSVARANLRAGPDTNSKILAVLLKGTKLEVVSKANQWYRVRLDNGTEGWIAESVVTSTRSD